MGKKCTGHAHILGMLSTVRMLFYSKPGYNSKLGHTGGGAEPGSVSVIARCKAGVICGSVEKPFLEGRKGRKEERMKY